MCGIAGYVTKENYSKSLIKSMTDVLEHRGPNASGSASFNTDGRKTALGHRRLSILDLSEAGKQPMAFEHLTITFNGEIYNHLDIRKELENEGYDFKSTSDTETLLKAFYHWGESCLDRLVGMFAFAVFNRKNGDLFLCRDRIGIKPLFYYQTSNVFIFASEMKALMLHPEFPTLPEIVFEYPELPNSLYARTR